MALGVVVWCAVGFLLVTGVCIPIAYFMPKESRSGCLLVSGGLFLVSALTLLVFLVD
ncbi:hypothetical protein [Streptomyces sp. NPDC051211]|uniref:hypothetical protein n=1 Tax=Streptomyces sp. NPDC051211 TaxID=3154643 RepID=UPI00344FDA0A